MSKMKKSSKEHHHKRSNYVGSSRHFSDWINKFEFEKTWLGKTVALAEKRYRLKEASIVFLFCLVLSYLLFYDFGVKYNYTSGELASVDIKSPVSFEVTDLVETEKKKTEAELNTPPVFDFDSSIYEKISNRVFSSFQNLRLIYGKDTKRRRVRERESNLSENKLAFEKILSIKVSNRVFDWLVKDGFSTNCENNIFTALERVSNEKITGSLKNTIGREHKKIVGRSIYNGEIGEEFYLEANKIVDLSSQPQFIKKIVNETIDVKPRQKRIYTELLQGLLTANFTLNQEETGSRIAGARSTVLPVVISIKKNQLIVSKGSVVQSTHITFLKEIQKLKSSKRVEFLALNSALLLTALLLIFSSYLRRVAFRRVKLTKKDYVVMSSISFLAVISVRIFWFMGSAALNSQLGTRIPEDFVLYMAPVSFASMLVGLLLPFNEVVWLFTIFISVVFGFMVDNKFLFSLYVMVSGMVAARGVYNCKKRNDIYVAGVRVGLVNVLILLTSYFIIKGTMVVSWSEISWLVLAAFLSGIFSSAAAMTLIPLLESLFNYTTNVRLLELSNLDHPLLKEMIVKAPGTYHHSLMVGALCESGAEKIGANPLLAKVMAYYHDIGKIEHASYFIENQRVGENPHDHISPHMSKTILIAHVKDGAELGMKHKLGKPIIDGILQHHGTTLISYFYNKALEAQGGNVAEVFEDDFRYPGPKPQFKEAALCMLADSIEAAARSLADPTASRLQNIVRNIIQRKFIDGQLDECELTLKDLSLLEENFERILLGIYHQRIDYPKNLGGGADSPCEKTSEMNIEKKVDKKNVS